MLHMPIVTNPAADDLSSLIDFKTSPLWEFLISIEAANNTWRFNSWTQSLRTALGESFLKELSRFDHETARLKMFNELAADVPDHFDIRSFFSFVENLSAREFLFYALGRLVPAEELTPPLNTEELSRKLAVYDNCKCPSPTPGDLEWVKRAETVRADLLSLWKRYYNEFYVYQETDYPEEYRAKFREWGHILDRQGGRALYSYVRESDWFPPNIPPEKEYTTIELIPIHRMPGHQRTYYGFGKITILCPSTETPETQQDMQVLKGELITILKALGDDSRLEILRYIVESEYGLNGKSIAAKLSISPSVVSRHLKQLKNAGIISERTEDNRNFYYGINGKAVRQINRKLLYFLTDRKD